MGCLSNNTVKKVVKLLLSFDLKWGYSLAVAKYSLDLYMYWTLKDT